MDDGDKYPGHEPLCWVRMRDPEDFQLLNPYSKQHCIQCHCDCDPDGPRCGHSAGCPGC
jgi:hypothetical protein